MIIRVAVFLLINFAGLAIGGFFTGQGVPSEWYTELNKAPWTPPGWMFGFAWTAIMICFALYMAYLWPTLENKSVLVELYAVQWLLNMIWNPVFFYFHKITAGLIIIVLLTVVIGYVLFRYWPFLKVKSVLLLPYLIWLIIATSLNGYIFLEN